MGDGRSEEGEHDLNGKNENLSFDGDPHNINNDKHYGLGDQNDSVMDNVLEKDDHTDEGNTTNLQENDIIVKKYTKNGDQ